MFFFGDRKGHEGMIDPRDLAQLGSGKSANLGEKTITENGEYSAKDDGVDGYANVSVNVPNTYTNEDEGKVVNSGALVAQTTMSEITENNTYDTTNYNSVTVNVAGSSGTEFSYMKAVVLNYTTATTATILNSEDGYYTYESNNTYYGSSEYFSTFSPVIEFQYKPSSGSLAIIAFTPHQNFNENARWPVIVNGTTYQANFTGDTITPGDGMTYVASLNLQSSSTYTYNISKKTFSWKNEIR